METTQAQLPELLLAGITARTNNANEFNGENAKIPSCIQKYFENGLFAQIPQRESPGITYCAYTDYTSDHTGDYTYFIGEKVRHADSPLPEGFHLLRIPQQSYVKFTTPAGQMPGIVIEAWQTIWQSPNPFFKNNQRLYTTDFELYDHRAQDPSASVVDIYIGIAND
jgi:predicted transcriptional regulator YdeE